jgi:hypothetical protein
MGAISLVTHVKILSANLQTCRSVGKTQARVDQNHQTESSVTIQSYTRKIKVKATSWRNTIIDGLRDYMKQPILQKIWLYGQTSESARVPVNSWAVWALSLFTVTQCTWESVTRHTQLVRSTKLMGVMGHIRGGVMISSCEYRPWMCNNVFREEVQECYQTAENVIYLGSSCPMACYHIMKTLPTISYDTQCSCDFTRLASSPPNNMPQR